MPDYDVVIVGGGIAGAMVAKAIVEKSGTPSPKILVLEAGTNQGWTYDGYLDYLDHFKTATVKGPNSPYPANPAAPSTTVFDIAVPTKPTDYYVQKGPLPFGSGYERALGGTTLHWLGTCLRMLPTDFKLNSTYGQGIDWPIDYYADDLKTKYERAERAIGVSGDKDEQYYPGLEPKSAAFKKYWGDYDYPMKKIPSSYLDQRLSKWVDGMTVESATGEPVSLKVSSTPQGRNSTPRPGSDFTPQGAVGAFETGQRCEGNSACVPICPVQAKYNAMKTWAEIDRKAPGSVTIQPQSVAYLVNTHSDTGEVTGVTYKRYENPEDPSKYTIETATGRLYVIAAHAIETAKLLLASNVANSSGQVGRNLMDHASAITWGLLPENIGAYRGPGSTSGIPAFRDGTFRRVHAAFRVEIGNWGWTWPAFSPNSDVNRMVDTYNMFGPELRNGLAEMLPRQFRIAWEPEQLPEPTNRVTIDEDYKDDLGNFKPVIHYDLSDYTKEALYVALQVSDKLFQRAAVQSYTTYSPAIDPGYFVYKGRPIAVNGAGHLVGTHRMGTTRHNSVVDKWQRTWDHKNLFLAGCGNFSTLGTSNPTLTLAALSLWLGDTIADELANGGGL